MDSTLGVQLAHLEIHLPGVPPFLGGLLLYSPSHGSLTIRTRLSWSMVPEEERDIFEGLEEQLQQLACSMGAAEFLHHVETTWSLTLRLANRVNVSVSPSEMELVADTLATLLLGAGTASARSAAASDRTR